jgi:electron transport complex protein RnfD
MSDSAVTGSTTLEPPPGAPQWTRLARNAPALLMHSGVSASRFVSMHALAAIFPATAGVILFGWRALGAMLVVMLSAAGAVFVWRNVGSRGHQLRYGHCVWLAALVALTLPAHLFGVADPLTGILLWPILVSAGVLLVITIWLFGGIGSGRVHPVLVTHLLLFLCFTNLLVPHYVLQARHVVFGDLFFSTRLDQATMLPWARTPEIPQADAVMLQPASQVLLSYTSGTLASERAWTSLDALLRDRMPPLEDLIIGGHPAPLGLGSTIAVIIGGLFLLYRGLIDFRVPLIIILSAALTILILPVPVVIKESDIVWRWLVIRAPDVGWPIALTLVSYELLAGPLVFMALFLATSPAVRPISRTARVIFSLIAGVLTGVFQIYISLAVGAYLALLIAGSLTALFDRIFRVRTLI